MKVLKGLAITFVLSVTAACVGVQADDYLSLVGIKIPSGVAQYTSAPVKKTSYSDQYVKSTSVSPNRSLTAYVKSDNGDVGSNHILKMGGCTKVTSLNAAGITPGYYHLKIQNTSFQLFGATYTGTWVLDEDLMNSSGICK